MQDSKNQIIRSMKSYEVGGTSEDAVKGALNKNKVGGTVKKRSGGPVSKIRTTTKRK
jgi:hypothetical protein